MAKSKVKEADIEVKEPQFVEPSLETKEYTLKQPHNGKQPGDTIRFGEKGAAYYRSKNVI